MLCQCAFDWSAKSLYSPKQAYFSSEKLTEAGSDSWARTVEKVCMADQRTGNLIYEIYLLSLTEFLNTSEVAKDCTTAHMDLEDERRLQAGRQAT